MSVRSLLLLAALVASVGAHAQAPKQEFRGAWVASVANLDWPSAPGLSTSRQKADLISLLDGLQDAGINAVVFQVRTESDALYDSPFEPWSYWLTGSQGTAPDPFYDPLELAVAEAHKRGMELHAWINPYRADRGSNYPKAPTHVTNEHPEWILSFPSGGIKILDPGLPEVRDRVSAIVADIVRRYDVDGIHYDDYFYPYSGTANEDDATFAAHSRGFTDRGDWRRDNVNRLVAQIQDSIQTVRPEVAHGVSPFGIWKNGVPTGTSGLDAYNVIYADAVAWLDAQTIDYVTPQLYWSSQRSYDTNNDGTPDTFNRQRFTTLAPWWESVRNERHLYPGLAPYRAGTPGFAANEIPTQIRFTRTQEGIGGTVLFRTYAGILSGGLGLGDSLRTDLYRRAALPPTMAWKNLDAPGAPTALSTTAPAGNQSGSVALEWTAPASGDADARFFAVYRIPSAAASDLPAALANGEHLVAVTGETTYVDAPPGDGLYTYAVTAVSANSVESAPSNTVQAQGATASEPAAPLALSLDAPRPNPVRGAVTLAFSLREAGPVTLRVVDVLGREVARLLDAESRVAGPDALVWRPDGVAGGTYIVVLEADGQRVTRPVLVVR